MFSSRFLWQVAISKSLLLLTFKAAIQATMTVAHEVVREKRETRFRSAFMQIKCGHCFFSALMLWPFSALNYVPSPLTHHCYSRQRWNNLCNHRDGLLILACSFFVYFSHPCKTLPKRWLKNLNHTTIKAQHFLRGLGVDGEWTPWKHVDRYILRIRSFSCVESLTNSSLSAARIKGWKEKHSCWKLGVAALHLTFLTLWQYVCIPHIIFLISCNRRMRYDNAVSKVTYFCCPGFFLF